MFLKKRPSKAGRGLSPSPATVHRKGPGTLQVLQFSSISFVSRQPSSSNTSGFQLYQCQGFSAGPLERMSKPWQLWEPNFIPSPPGESGSSPPNAAVLTHTVSHPHTVPHTHPPAPQCINTGIPLGNNVFSRSSRLGCVAVHKHQRAECFSCIAKGHFLTLQWDTAFYPAVGCFVWVDFVVAPKCLKTPAVAIPPQC